MFDKQEKITKFSLRGVDINQLYIKTSEMSKLRTKLEKVTKLGETKGELVGQDLMLVGQLPRQLFVKLHPWAHPFLP